MNALRFVLFLLLFSAACSHLPGIRSDNDALQRHGADCKRVFPQGKWQFLHTIKAAPPGGGTQTVLGLSQISSASGTAHCVMMTLEGLVFFEAHYDGELHIQRALPPFDAPGFAEGLMEDLLLIFFAPRSPLMAAGYLSDNARVCRFSLTDGGAEDIVVQRDGHWKIHRYNQQQRLVRTIQPDPSEGLSSQGFPGRIVLEAHGLAGYHLSATLLEAEPMQQGPNLLKNCP